MIDLETKWDVIVIGGGITGAGIFREAVRADLKTLLLEQKDFAWGTSSRSSKLVHGGLRYLKEGRFFLTRDAVRERERLLAEARGLVTPMGFWCPYTRIGAPVAGRSKPVCPFTISSPNAVNIAISTPMLLSGKCPISIGKD